MTRRPVFANPRFEYLIHAHPKCPECDDTKQQFIVTTWEVPAQWGCRVCRFQYGYEPEGTPTLADAERALAAAYPAIPRPLIKEE